VQQQVRRRVQHELPGEGDCAAWRGTPLAGMRPRSRPRGAGGSVPGARLQRQIPVQARGSSSALRGAPLQRGSTAKRLLPAADAFTLASPPCAEEAAKLVRPCQPSRCCRCAGHVELGSRRRLLAPAASLSAGKAGVSLHRNFAIASFSLDASTRVAGPDRAGLERLLPLPPSPARRERGWG
jgi:hypothetical protein